MNSSKCNLCQHFHSFCARLTQLPFYREIKIPKTTMREMPRCFEETLLGEPKGSLKQFRGPHGSHILEYEDAWVLHRDKVDPRLDPIGHLITDAPHVLVLGSIAVLVLLGLMLIAGGEKE